MNDQQGHPESSMKAGDADGLPLSLVMIAKDEEQNLPRALQSAAPWVDEIILVDTGSRDRTMDIAREFGARIYQHPWREDFALHRNQALSYAKGDWCLQLDADEEIVAETAPLLSQLVQDPEASAFNVKMLNLNPQGGYTSFKSPRLFRRTDEVRYERAVHNQLNRPALSRVKDCGLSMIHYGYAGDRESLRKKRERRLAMTSAWTGREPENWEAWFYSAQALTTAPHREGDLEKAAAAAQKALELAKGSGVGPLFYQAAYLPLLISLEVLGRPKRHLEIAGLWAGEEPRNPDPHFFTASACNRLGDWAGLCRAAQDYLNALAKLESYPGAKLGLEFVSQRRKADLIIAWLSAAARLGRKGQYLPAFELLMGEPQAEAACLNAIKLLARQGLAQIAQEIAARMIAAHPEWQWCRQILAGQNPARSAAQA